jgi:nucleotide-binding universal stress UspA family protein
MTQPIVVGYDGSACSRDALAAAVALAEDSAGEVIIVYCHEIPAGLACELDPACAAARELRDFERHIAQDVAPLLEEAALGARRCGVPAETVVAWGDCVGALRRTAVEREARLVVVGAHGEGLMGAVLRRSPCFGLIHDCPLPVLVVPHPKEARAAS